MADLDLWRAPVGRCSRLHHFPSRARPVPTRAANAPSAVTRCSVVSCGRQTRSLLGRRATYPIRNRILWITVPEDRGGGTADDAGPSAPSPASDARHRDVPIWANFGQESGQEERLRARERGLVAAGELSDEFKAATRASSRELEMRRSCAPGGASRAKRGRRTQGSGAMPESHSAADRERRACREVGPAGTPRLAQHAWAAGSPALNGRSDCRQW